MPSTVIKSYTYDAASHSLCLQFVHGGQYRYKNFPAEAFKAFRAAYLKGEFFARHIRSHYDFEKIA